MNNIVAKGNLITIRTRGTTKKGIAGMLPNRMRHKNIKGVVTQENMVKEATESMINISKGIGIIIGKMSIAITEKLKREGARTREKNIKWEK